MMPAINTTIKNITDIVKRRLNNLMTNYTFTLSVNKLIVHILFHDIPTFQYINCSLELIIKG